MLVTGYVLLGVDKKSGFEKYLGDILSQERSYQNLPPDLVRNSMPGNE
tara:strand:- start:1720 stop:1863 length:144 start_codon:yes stop_codon:yes gene_type:complete